MLICMRTTLMLPDDLYRQVKRAAAEGDRTVTSFVEEALRAAAGARRGNAVRLVRSVCGVGVAGEGGAQSRLDERGDRAVSFGGGALHLPVEVVGEHESGAHAYEHIEGMAMRTRLPLRRSPRAPSSLRHGAAPPGLAQEVTGVARNSDSGMPSPPTSSVVSG